MSHLAKRHRQHRTLDEFERVIDTTPMSGEIQVPEETAELEVVRELIAALPDGPEKETVRLFYLEGELTARQIADRLGVGKSAVTMRLERFRARVKKALMARVLALRGEGPEQRPLPRVAESSGKRSK